MAVRDVRAAYPSAMMLHLKSWEGFYIYTSDPALQGAALIGTGKSPKEAWWNARTKALAVVLAE